MIRCSEWMSGLLEARGKQAFGDQVRREDIELRYRHKLQVIAPDVIERRLLVLPRDAPKLGIVDSDDIDAALAVLMSIPVFFEPVRFPTRRAGREHLIVDHEFDWTIAKDALDVRTTEFVSPQHAMRLFESGRDAARRFLVEHRNREKLRQL